MQSINGLGIDIVLVGHYHQQKIVRHEKTFNFSW